MEFQYPELLLFAIPAWFVYRKFGTAEGWTGWLRAGMLALVILSLAGPKFNIGGRGVDVMLVVDRSRSMPGESDERIKELIRNLENNSQAGNRVGIITFGSEALEERRLSNTESFDNYKREIMPDGSDLNKALEKALSYVKGRRRPARILVLSDGEYNGPSPTSAARQARDAGVPIDYRIFERTREGDIAVDSLMMPQTVSPREPFQFSANIYADKPSEGTVIIKRGDTVIARRDVKFDLGMNVIPFRDLNESGGFYQYSVELEVNNDPVIENNRGVGVIRVDSGPKILVVTSDGQMDNFARALQSARLPFDVVKSTTFPFTQDALDSYRAVVINNVAARDLGRTKMIQIAQFVEDLGGGFMLTGGQRSFGVGGYFNSPLDDILPVSMEMREEHRKSRLALAVVLDRSGSMAMPVAGGKTKMDLANLGTAECVRLLSPGDSVSIIAVDSSAHIIQPLRDVDDSEAIARKALGIESMGGGIFVYTGLLAAGRELMKAEQTTQHIILFSDAQDSEEPGDYQNLLKKFETAGITVSVIGLGTDKDVDAAFLKDIAKRGSGNAMFTTDPKELPRLFSEDTMAVARSSFIEKDPETQSNGIGGQVLPDSQLIGKIDLGSFPKIDGYNLSYLKPDATMGVISQDEYQAPWMAFWYRGLGRSAALSLEVDGKFSGQFGKWENYNDFLITHARWLLGSSSPNDIFVEVQQDGQDAVATIELDPDRPNQDSSKPPQLVIVPPGTERVEPITPEFVWLGPHTLQARFRMERNGTYRTLIKTDSKTFQRGPAIALPYSPEFVPRIDLPSGANTLTEVAEISGGEGRTDVLEVFKNPPRSARRISLIPFFLSLSIILLVVEIAGRRLSLWEQTTEKSDEQFVEKAANWLPKMSWKRKKKVRVSKPAPVQSSAPPKPEKKKESKPKEEVKPKVDVYAQAKNRANRRNQ